MPSPSVITRFAPSPTGHLHIGGARTALFCWAFARRQGDTGTFLLRIEDTDQARSSEASARGILEDLAWLGIVWDEGPSLAGEKPIGGDPRGVGPFFQAQRLHIYNAAIEELIAQGRAYPAFEKPEELEAKRRAAAAAKQTYRYDRAALLIPPEERLRRMRAGETHVVRFRMPDEEVVVRDEVLGEVRYAAGETEDFVIRKADGFPTYHFAVVVDDAKMGVTHVLRGQEHLNNTPKHVALQQALGYPTPVYAHMPLIFNMDGGKMSKRDKDKAVREACVKAGIKALDALHGAPPAGLTQERLAAWLGDKTSQLPTDLLEWVAGAVGIKPPEIEVHDFRKAGYLPEVLCNFIALLGWSPGGDVEKFGMSFLAQHFGIDRIGKSNGRFDRVKLLSFNTEAITHLQPELFKDRFRIWCEAFEPGLVALPAQAFSLLCAAVQPRCKTLRDAAEQCLFVLQNDAEIVYEPKAVEKTLKKAAAGEPAGLAVLAELRAALAGVGDFSPPAIHAALEGFAAARSLGMGKVAQPLRVALTGTTVSPPIDATLAILGRDRSLARIDRCLKLAGA